MMYECVLKNIETKNKFFYKTSQTVYEYTHAHT